MFNCYSLVKRVWLGVAEKVAERQEQGAIGVLEWGKGIYGGRVTG